MSVAAHAVLPTEDNHPFASVGRKKLAMWLFLGSDAMGFTGLLAAYFVLRLSAGDGWIPLVPNPDNPDELIPFNIDQTAVLTGINTFLLICSSVTMVLSLSALRRGIMKRFKTCLFLTMLGGIGFLSIQAYEWTHLIQSGVTAPASNFGGIFYLLTGYHGFHVLGGVVLLAWAYIRALKGVYTPENSVGIEVVGLYWHFVDLVWILIFTIIYLL
ncbi:MAG: cytochrome c oxidase subunit 3 [Planctomycetota bacterium]|jgi:heme/copper-type cytochrome/quinol oxidase subunit 3